MASRRGTTRISEIQLYYPCSLCPSVTDLIWVGRRLQWLDAHDGLAGPDPRDPAAVVAWFHTMISAKVHRALRGLAADVPELAGRLRWLRQGRASGYRTIAHGVVAVGGSWTRITAEIDPFLADLVWLGEALEREFPNARAFVTPAFDEPDDVATLLSAEGLD